MDTDTLLEHLRTEGALMEGHFSLSSGLHSDRYVQCARLMAATPVAAKVGAALAERLPSNLDLIVSPAMGGLIIGHEVARALGLPFLFTERVDGVMSFRRFDVPEGARAAVVEDVVTSGGSLIEAAEAFRSVGGELAAAAAIVDRSGGTRPDFGVPFASLLELTVQTWQPDACPLCAEGGLAVKPGSRHLGGAKA